MDRPRLCDRPACGTAATACLTFQYANRRVWLDDLDPDPEPAMIELCTFHADRVSVPVGWSGEDRRSTDPAEASVSEPLAG
jgi:hypothetical protein